MRSKPCKGCDGDGGRKRSPDLVGTRGSNQIEGGGGGGYGGRNRSPDQVWD